MEAAGKPSLTASLTPFDPGQRYQVQRLIGQGSYGLVASALDVTTNERVAIKKISPFDHKTFCLRTLREIKLLKLFQHENIIALRDIVCPPSCEAMTDIYVVQDLMQADLNAIISIQQLSDDHVQYLTYQILKAVLYVHSANCLHRDLKPSNVLINENCDVKICDFGLARSADSYIENSNLLTEYVTTRWYRAPEIMLSHRHYSKAIDMWSVGCILAEMLLRQPLFPGRDYWHQLDLIFGVLGTPSEEDVGYIHSQSVVNFIKRLPPRTATPFSTILPHGSQGALDLLQHLLVFNPSKRFTVEDALNHPYMQQYHDPDDEPRAVPIPQSFFAFDYQTEQLNKEQLKELIFHEIRSWSQLQETQI